MGVARFFGPKKEIRKGSSQYPSDGDLVTSSSSFFFWGPMILVAPCLVSLPPQHHVDTWL